jgi:hypothetical protein
MNALGTLCAGIDNNPDMPNLNFKVLEQVQPPFFEASVPVNLNILIPQILSAN